MTDETTDTDDVQNEELPDFDDYQTEGDEGDETLDGDSRDDEVEAGDRPEPVDPLADDFRIGDPVIDLANGRNMVIVDRVADRTDTHSKLEGYDFLENYGNERLRARAADPVFECVYVTSVQSEPSKTYDFPTSRLGRPRYENPTGVRRVYEAVASDLLERMFLAVAEVEGVTEFAISDVSKRAGVDDDLVDEALELAEVESSFESADVGERSDE